MTRSARPGKPHVRIPDEFYRFLKFFRPIEIVLVLALSCQAWRVKGPDRGLVKKSLKEIARDIEMPWSVARRAWKRLEEMKFVRRDGKRLYLECDLLATAIATDFATLGDRRSGPPAAPGDRRSGPPAAPGDRRSGPPAAPNDRNSGPLGTSFGAARNVVRGRQRPPTTDNGNGLNAFTPGRSDDPMIRRAHSRARATETEPHCEIGESPPVARSQGSLPPGGNGKAKKIDRDVLMRILADARRFAEAKAVEAEAARNAEREAKLEKLHARKDELKRQADDLLAQEGKTT